MKKISHILPRFKAFSVVLLYILGAIIGVTACTPTIQLDTPKEGITINMNVVVDHNISVKMDEKSQKVVKELQ